MKKMMQGIGISIIDYKINAFKKFQCAGESPGDVVKLQI